MFSDFDFNDLISAAIGLVVMMLAALMSYLLYKFKTVYQEYRLRDLQCTNVYNQLVQARTITPIPETPIESKRRLVRFKDYILSTPKRLFTRNTIDDNNNNDQTFVKQPFDAYDTQLVLGPRKSLFVCHSPSLPNLNVAEREGGRFIIEPLHAPTESNMGGRFLQRLGQSFDESDLSLVMPVSKTQQQRIRNQQLTSSPSLMHRTAAEMNRLHLQAAVSGASGSGFCEIELHAPGNMNNNDRNSSSSSEIEVYSKPPTPSIKTTKM